MAASREKRMLNYSPLGKRIAALAEHQREIGKALGISQQTVSHKLRGRVGILVTDLERLAIHYKVPITYFFKGWTPKEGRSSIRRRKRHLASIPS